MVPLSVFEAGLSYSVGQDHESFGQDKIAIAD